MKEQEGICAMATTLLSGPAHGGGGALKRVSGLRSAIATPALHRLQSMNAFVSDLPRLMPVKVEMQGRDRV